MVSELISKKIDSEINEFLEEVLQENKALHKEVSRLIDENGKQELCINELRNKIYQSSEECHDRRLESIGNFLELYSIVKKEENVHESTYNQLHDLFSEVSKEKDAMFDVINDMACMLLGLDYDDKKEVYFTDSTLEGDELEDNQFWCDKINKALGVSNVKSK